MYKSTIGRVVFIAGATLCASAALAQQASTTPPDTASLGVEGFYDRYREPDPDVTINSGYGSVTGNYTFNFDPTFFAAVDGRASYGTDHYSSPSGTVSGNPQWETDLRGRGGITFWNDEEGDKLASYTGVGWRYFEDEGKGSVTNLGKFGYDRRISQVYLPLGVTYTDHISENWSLIPTIEYDELLWGQVNSRLQNDGPLCYPYTYNGKQVCVTSPVNPRNTQSSGYGLRGDITLRNTINSTTSWEIGPFVRYWDIHQSNTLYYPINVPGYSVGVDEPHNTRMQVGLKLSVLW